ncbi:MAG: hypothetical protein NTV29_17625 [Planctomycetota bacterium]|nr:hypothetical protein [Planctomycetota bacterium]
MPQLDAIVLEKEVFPRDHVGDSPYAMGVWEKFDPPGVPIKLGALYPWGRTSEPWPEEGEIVFSNIPQEPCQESMVGSFL